MLKRASFEDIAGNLFYNNPGQSSRKTRFFRSKSNLLVISFSFFRRLERLTLSFFLVVVVVVADLYRSKHEASLVTTAVGYIAHDRLVPGKPRLLLFPFLFLSFFLISLSLSFLFLLLSSLKVAKRVPMTWPCKG